MKKLKAVRRWTVRVLGLLLLVSALFVSGAAMGQGPPASQLPKITYTKNTIFHLPVQMDEKTRASMREVCLYVKAGNGEWVRQETGLPTHSHFNYKVPQDGEYWFSLVTIDKNGRMNPPDVNQEPPGLRVVVDTQAPVLDIQPWMSPEGEACLRCQVQDANPDLQSVKATYRDPAGEHVLESVPGNPTLFKIAGQQVLNQSLRISAADLSGNVVTREVNVREMLSALLQNNKSVAPKVAAAVPPIDQLPPMANVPGDLIRTEAQRPVLPPVPPQMEKIAEFTPPPNPALMSQGSNIVQPLPSAPVPYLPSAPPLPSMPNKEIQQVKTTVPGMPNANMPKLILNSTHATIDYRIDQVGPSGVGKVEVYMTGDGGQNWQRLQEDKDKRSPVEIDLPGEGLFGIRLAITNGNGFGGTPPARGDAPTCWIEVDTTAPFAQLRPIDPAQNGVMELRWTASDKNLGPEPITLHYKTRIDGPWQIIARNVKNEGLYRWTFPRDQGSQFFVKIGVNDLAGNSAHVETPNAIVLDITEPHASVVGVTGMSQRTTAPVGN